MNFEDILLSTKLSWSQEDKYCMITLNMRYLEESKSEMESRSGVARD